MKKIMDWIVRALSCLDVCKTLFKCSLFVRFMTVVCYPPSNSLSLKNFICIAFLLTFLREHAFSKFFIDPRGVALPNLLSNQFLC